jgi:acyl-coenzyme A synthetase/AMP-(fatty) acid ligase
MKVDDSRHYKVLEAAVICVAQLERQERPLACVVPKPCEELTKEEILVFLKDKVGPSGGSPTTCYSSRRS